MKLVKVREVVKLPGTPSPEAIYRMFRRPAEEWPSFAHLTNNGRKAIDVNDPSWAEYLARRSFVRRVGDKAGSLRQKFRRGNKRSVKKSKPKIQNLKGSKDVQSKSKDLIGLTEDAVRADLEKKIADAQAAQYRAENEKIKLQVAQKDVVYTDFAKFAFWGYWSRINTELIGMRRRIGERIKNMVQAGDAKGVLDLIDAEHDEIIREVMAQHKQDLAGYGINADY